MGNQKDSTTTEQTQADTNKTQAETNKEQAAEHPAPETKGGDGKSNLDD